jgi:hypothetical protein
MLILLNHHALSKTGLIMQKTKLSDQGLSSELMYKSLISSRSKKNKTGEWVVFSKTDSGIKF